MKGIKTDPTKGQSEEVKKAADKAHATALRSFLKHRGRRTEAKQIRLIFDAGRAFEAQYAVQSIAGQDNIIQALSDQLREQGDVFAQIMAYATPAGKYTKSDMESLLNSIADLAVKYQIVIGEEGEI